MQFFHQNHPLRVRQQWRCRTWPQTQTNARSDRFKAQLGYIWKEFMLLRVLPPSRTPSEHFWSRVSIRRGRIGNVRRSEPIRQVLFQVYLNRHQMENISIPHRRSFPSDGPWYMSWTGKIIIFFYHILQKNGDKDPLVLKFYFIYVRKPSLNEQSLKEKDLKL